MSSTPQPIVKNPTPWFSHEEIFVINILVYCGDKFLESIRAQMETAKYNHNKVTRLIAYTGLESAELVSSLHPKDASNEFWYFNRFRVKF